MVITQQMGIEASLEKNKTLGGMTIINDLNA
jgi:hypothetical protein